MSQALLEEVAINSTVVWQELTEDGGNRLLEGTNKILGASRAQGKGVVTSQETDPDLPVSVLESLA